MPPARGFLLAHYPQRPGSLASCADPHRLRFANLQRHDLTFRLQRHASPRLSASLLLPNSELLRVHFSFLDNIRKRPDLP